MKQLQDDEQDEVQDTPGHYECITCPICGSRAIAFVTEYHKCIFAKIIMCVFLAITCLCVFEYYSGNLRGDANSGLRAAAIIFGILTVILLFSVFVEESKTHVRAICRDCGNLWLLD